MNTSQGAQATPPARHRRSPVIVAAFVAFAIANLIHNRYGFDSAIAPATLLLALYLWRPRRGLLWATALLLALPSFAFLNWRALVIPTGSLHMLNQAALFVSGVLAILSVVLSLLAERRSARPA